MKIEMGKKYKLKGKTDLKFDRVLCTDAGEKYPVVILWKNDTITRHTDEGKYSLIYDSDRDLVEASEWDDFKKDDKVMVSSDGVVWNKRYFSHVDTDGRPWAFSSGETSWTAGSAMPWKLCRRPTPEELGEDKSHE